MKVVLLNSGGLDSACVAKKLHTDGHEVYSLYLDLGQLNSETAKVAAQEIATKWCVSHKVISIDFGLPYAVEYEGVLWSSIHATSMMSYIGASYARLLDITDVYTGIKVVVDETYEDRINDLLENVKVGNWRPIVHAPLTKLNGQDIFEWSGSTMAEMAFTVSCNAETPCGVCNKCKLREALSD